MVALLLLACSGASLSAAPDVSGIPTPIASRVVEVTQEQTPPAPAVSASRVDGHLRVVLSGVDSCDKYDNAVSTTKAAGWLEVRLTVTAPPQAGSASFQCRPQTSTRIALEADVGDTILEVRYVDADGKILASHAMVAAP